MSGVDLLGDSHAKCDLSLSCSQENAKGGIVGKIEFNSDIFERSSIERLAAQRLPKSRLLQVGETLAMKELSANF